MNLPASSAGFVGRDGELAEIARLLSDPACRLLTLVGPGGIGKTRLAIEAARHLSPPDRVRFVPFQPLTSPDFMVSAMADTLGFPFYSGSDPKQQLLDFLREKSWLLILDNFEHLLDGAGLLSEILTSAPGLRLLVTSRERLNLIEEWVLDVGGLAYPSSESDAEADHYSAVGLFMQHARRLKADFRFNEAQRAAVVRICRLVGGMPLAIELAASWVRALSCEAIADEISRSLDILETPARNVEPRHRTMRAAFEPTWNRLSEHEREVFMRLSVFRGGFTREAAKEVTGASLRTLSALIDRSLLRVDANGRYDVHELLRQYAAERLNLSADGSDRIRDRHCTYYTSLLERCWPRLTGGEIKSALSEINTELENIRLAWDWALSQHIVGKIEAALDSLWLYYDQGSRYHEGEQVFARTVNILNASSSGQDGLRAKVLARQGALCRMLLLRDRSKALLEESVALLRRSGVSSHLAFALARLSAVTPEQSIRLEYLEESLSIYTELDDHWGMGEALNWLCVFHIVEPFSRETLLRARRYGQEELAVSQQFGSLYGIARACLNVGQTAYYLEEYAQAHEYFQTSLETFQDIGIYWGIPISLWNLGFCACALGNYADARRFSLQGLQIAFDPDVTSDLQYIYPLLILVAEIWLAEGEIERAYELLALADQWRQKVGFSKNYAPFQPLSLLDEDLPPHLVAAVVRGKERDLDAVVKEAVDELTRHLETSTPITALTSLYPLAEPLSARELEILRLMADGLSNGEIAEQLVLARSTIKWYVRQIFSKLDATSRTQSVARGRTLGLLS